jgi:ABC-type transport system substrate-binding protein
VLKRNPYYGGPHPARLDAIVIREGLDAEKAVSEVERSDWQGLALTDPVVLRGSAVARRYAHAGSSLAYRVLPEPSLDYLALNAGRGPLRGVAFRQRIAGALERAALAANDNLTPTTGLLPPALRGDALDADARTQQGTPAARPVSLRMAYESDCWQCRQLADIVAAELRPLDATLTTVPVANLAAAIRAPGSRIDLAALSTTLPYPDPASFLTQMLGHDVPQSWLSATARTAVARLRQLSGATRYRTALVLARNLGRTNVPVVAYGTPQIGALLRPELGCRRWDAFDAELDLTTLCLTTG